VLGECFAALLRIDPDKSIGFVASYLEDRNEAVGESAALALGESRLETAFDILRQAFDRAANRALRRTLLVAIALLRREPALDYLLDLVTNGEEPDSADAVAALSMYKDDARLRDRLEQARVTSLSNKGTAR
jgi:HEAT repeat protein